MKKWAMLLLILLVVPTFALAAEPAAYEVSTDYEGVAWDIPGCNLALKLPDSWEQTGTQNTDYFFSNEGDTEAMVISVSPAEDMTLERAAEGLGSAEGIDAVELAYINNVPTVSYVVEADNVFGFFLTTQDGDALLNFVFSPLTETMASLGMQVIGSIMPQ